ncbi:MAG: chemotaxis protein CheW [Gammaproteobacteria bacterium]|nr:chemotaxis protein CheW [Gammaproteobacteria bacterium]
MNNQELKLSTVSLSAVLSPPDAVVQDYLDFMLRAVTETVSEVAVARPVPSKPVLEAVVEARRPAPEPIVEPFVKPFVGPIVETKSNTIVVTTAAAAPAPAPVASPRGANGRPLWAQAPFECLLFQVVGLKLAAPLVELGGIARIGDGLTPIFGQSDWFMGLLRWNDRNIRVVDTARLIMPERLPALVGGQRPPYEFVLLIEGTDWGLAIDSATEAMHLQPDEVRWRASLQNRQWLAGTVLEKMCALLDMSSVARLLQVETTTG